MTPRGGGAERRFAGMPVAISDLRPANIRGYTPSPPQVIAQTHWALRAGLQHLAAGFKFLRAVKPDNHPACAPAFTAHGFVAVVAIANTKLAVVVGNNQWGQRQRRCQVLGQPGDLLFPRSRGDDVFHVRLGTTAAAEQLELDFQRPLPPALLKIKSISKARVSPLACRKIAVK